MDWVKHLSFNNRHKPLILKLFFGRYVLLQLEIEPKLLVGYVKNFFLNYVIEHTHTFDLERRTVTHMQRSQAFISTTSLSLAITWRCTRTATWSLFIRFILNHHISMISKAGSKVHNRGIWNLMQMKKIKMKISMRTIVWIYSLTFFPSTGVLHSQAQQLQHIVYEKFLKYFVKVRSVSLYPSALVWHFQNLMQEK